MANSCRADNGAAAGATWKDLWDFAFLGCGSTCAFFDGRVYFDAFVSKVCHSKPVGENTEPLPS